jgi:hypothetical protein
MWAFLKALNVISDAKLAGRKPTEEEWQAFDDACWSVWEAALDEDPLTT